MLKRTFSFYLLLFHLVHSNFDNGFFNCCIFLSFYFFGFWFFFFFSYFSKLSSTNYYSGRGFNSLICFIKYAFSSLNCSSSERSLWNLDRKSTSLSWFRRRMSKMGLGLLGLATKTWKTILKNIKEQLDAKVYFISEELKIWRTLPNLTHFGGKNPSWLGGAEIDSVWRPKLVLGPAISQLHLISWSFFTAQMS